MVSLTFYGGVNEIGGNKILLTDGDTKIWLDFGQSFTMGVDYYVNWLQPRSCLRDYFEFGLLPELEGLYREDMLKGTPLEYREAEYQGVFITHAHSDHVSHIKFIDPCILVYTGKGTRLFMEAMEKTSTWSNYGEHDYRGFRTGDVARIDGVEVEPIHVDHSIPAAYGYIIRHSEGALVYTGDMRAHGPKAGMTQEFLESAQYAEPGGMVCEGTRMARKGKRRNLSEAQVERGVKEVCAEADRDGKSVIYTHPSRDMDRLRTFHRAAESSGRVMVINPKTAYLLDRLIEDEHLDLPDPNTDDLLRVYYRRKRSGTYSERDYYVWERGYMDRMITVDELRTRPTDHILNLNFINFTELIDLRPEPGSHYIYSMSEPFSEEDIEHDVLLNWLGHFGLEYHQLHASGHMSPKELGEAVNYVEPGTVYPVHCEEPELFRKYYGSVTLPEVGREYRI